MHTEPLIQFDKAIIGALIRDARLSVGFSLRELGKRTGTSHSTISAYEHGHKYPSLPVLNRLLTECGVNLELHCTRRIRHCYGLDRGDELEQVLALAEQFPTKPAKNLEFPRFGIQ